MALATGAYVIDSSSHYRLEKISELIVPPVNRDLINKSQKLYSHANCLASPISTVIAPILKEYNIKRLVISTYQSVSGAGKLPLDEFYEASKTFVNNIIEPNLYNHKETLKSEFFPKQSAFNIIPQVGDLLENKSSSEEYKIEHELKKILNKNLPISVTAVRVPVFVGHSISLNIEFHEEIDLGNINKILRNAEAVILDKEYTTPLELKSNGQVFVGRIRQDNSVNFGLNMWICSDNLNRGAAIDAAEILESLLKLL